MQTSSTSIIRHFSSAALASFLRRTSIYQGGSGFGVGIGTRRSFYFLAAKRENPNVSGNNIHRAFCAPGLSSDKEPLLFKSKAIGTVVTAQASYMRVIVQREAVDGDDGDDGDERSSSNIGFEILCEVRTMLRKLGKIVLVGDRVLVEDIDWIDRRGMIVNLFDRHSENVDPPVANVDHLLVFFSLDEPKLKPNILTRFLVQAESSGIPLTLALNKCELITQEELESWRIRLRGWNYEPLFCSVETNVGLDEIALNLRNKTSVIIGPSGVGKSSLINILRSSSSGVMEDENWFNPILGLMYDGQKKKKKKKWFEDQRVDEVSKKNCKGIHTTRNVTLMQLSGGGYIADTPGSNKHKLLKVTKQSLPLCFPEIRKMIEGGKCEFSNCSHIGVPGCAVLEGGWERYTYYLQLLDEIRTEEESQLKKYGTKKREGDVRYKVGGKYVKRAKPLLEHKNENKRR